MRSRTSVTNRHLSPQTDQDSPMSSRRGDSPRRNSRRESVIFSLNESQAAHHAMKDRQRQLEQSIMSSQLEKVEKAQKARNIDFSNQMFDKYSIKELMTKNFDKSAHDEDDQEDLLFASHKERLDMKTRRSYVRTDSENQDHDLLIMRIDTQRILQTSEKAGTEPKSMSHLKNKLARAKRRRQRGQPIKHESTFKKENSKKGSQLDIGRNSTELDPLIEDIQEESSESNSLCTDSDLSQILEEGIEETKVQSQVDQEETPAVKFKKTVKFQEPAQLSTDNQDRARQSSTSLGRVNTKPDDKTQDATNALKQAATTRRNKFLSKNGGPGAQTMSELDGVDGAILNRVFGTIKMPVPKTGPRSTKKLGEFQRFQELRDGPGQPASKDESKSSPKETKKQFKQKTFKMTNNVKRMEKYATEHLNNQFEKMQVETSTDIKVEKETGGKDGNVFENTLAGAMEDERESDKLDHQLTRKQTARKSLEQINRRQSFMESQRRSSIQSDSVRKAIHLYRKQLDKKSSQATDEMAVNSDEEDKKKIKQEALLKDQNLKAELARLIEQTYQYIYSVEDKRMSRKINKVEDLFDSNPLNFDGSSVSHQLDRLKKLKQNADLLKSHVQVYQEKMVEQKHSREFNQFLIDKYQIDIKLDEYKLSEGEVHIRNCDDDYLAYHTYKSNRFFEQETAHDRQPKQASALIKFIIGKVTMKEELIILGRCITKLLNPKMQRILLQKCQNYLRIDYDDPSTYIQVDQNQYQRKQPSSPASSSRDNLSRVGSPTQSPTRLTSSGPSTPVKPTPQKKKSSLQAVEALKMLQPKLQKIPSNISSPTFDRKLMKKGSTMTSTSVLSSSIGRGPPKGDAMVLHSNAVEDKPIMVRAYNMVFILAQVNDASVKKKIEQQLCRYIEGQLRTMPRVVDQDEGLKERFANLQKLLESVTDLPNKVTWEKKEYIPSYRRPGAEQEDINTQNSLDSRQQMSQREQEIALHKSRTTFKRLHIQDIDVQDPLSGFKHSQTSSNINGQRNSNSSGLFEQSSTKARVTFNNVQAYQMSKSRGDISLKTSAQSSGTNSPDHFNDDSVFSQHRNMNEDIVNGIHDEKLRISDHGFTKKQIKSNQSTKRDKNALKQVVGILAKEMIKKQVPKKVFEDCADILNQSFCYDQDAKIKHQQRTSAMHKKRLSINKQEFLQPGERHRYRTPQNRNGMMSQSHQNMSQMMTQESMRYSSRAQFDQNDSILSQNTGKRGGSVMKSAFTQKNRNSSYLLPRLSQEKQSRNMDHQVYNRSLDMLQRLKQRKINQSVEFESTKAKFKQSVQEITKDCEFKVKKRAASQQRALKQRKYSQDSMMSSTGSIGDISQITENRKKLRNVIRLCMNDAYLQADVEEKQRKQNRRNKATFKSAGKKDKNSIDELNDLGDQAGLAFRQDALKALNQDNILFKKIEMHNYVEDLRSAANREIYDFLEAIDPDTAPKNLKLLYFYFVGSRNLFQEMTTESVQNYRLDQMQPVRNDLRKAITGQGAKRLATQRKYQ